MRSTVVILAAGRGSRAGEVTDNQSKCVVDLDRTNPILHTLRSFEKVGVTDAIVVTGYQESGVRCAVNKGLHHFGSKMNVKFVYNQDFDYHGCEYSLSCAASEMKKYNTVIITEGDLIMDPEYIKRIVEDNSPSAALFRDKRHIIDTKSVVGVSDSDTSYVDKYVYDSTHESVLRFIYDKDTIVGDSMQVWKFSGDSLKKLVSTLECYKRDADTSKVSEDRPYKHNGLYSINKVIKDQPIKAVVLPEADRWHNLNTKEDINTARKFNWLNRYTMEK